MDEIRKSSIPLGIKPKRIFNEVSYTRNEIYMSLIQFN